MGLKNVLGDIALEETQDDIKREAIDQHTRLLTEILLQLKLLNMHMAEAYETGYSEADVREDEPWSSGLS